MTAVCLTIVKIEGLMSYNAPVTLGLGAPTGEKWGQTGGQSRAAAARAMLIRITSPVFSPNVCKMARLGRRTARVFSDVRLRGVW
jgi:hypothetical protein